MNNSSFIVTSGLQQKTAHFLGQKCDGKMFAVKDNATLEGYTNIVDRYKKH